MDRKLTPFHQTTYYETHLAQPQRSQKLHTPITERNTQGNLHRAPSCTKKRDNRESQMKKNNVTVTPTPDCIIMKLTSLDSHSAPRNSTYP